VRRDGAVLRLHDARRVDAAGASPGRGAAIGPDGVVVGAQGGAVRVGRLRVGDKKVAAHEAAASLGLSPGQPFGDAG
jgi:hypothetical protein